MMVHYFKSLRTKESIEKRYKELAKQLHPDVNPGIDSDLFVEMSNQYKKALERCMNKQYDRSKKQEDAGTNTNENKNDASDAVEPLEVNDGEKVKVKINFGNFTFKWSGKLPFKLPL